MDLIELITPQTAHEVQVKEYIHEHAANNESEIHGGALIEKMDYNIWLKQLTNNSNPSTVDKNWVVASTFFAIRTGDKKIVGMIDIRHTLNELLQKYGGHIGLGVRPTERKKGYAGQMLKQGLEYARKIEIQEIMLACYKDNVASRNTILKCGGVLEKEFPLSEIKEFGFTEKDLNEKIVQVYWVQL